MFVLFSLIFCESNFQMVIQVNFDGRDFNSQLLFFSRLAAQVREEDKSSYVAEWASKHAFGPPSPQGDHHGEQDDVIVVVVEDLVHFFFSQAHLPL